MKYICNIFVWLLFEISIGTWNFKSNKCGSFYSTLTFDIVFDKTRESHPYLVQNWWVINNGWEWQSPKSPASMGKKTVLVDSAHKGKNVVIKSVPKGAQMA